MPSRSNPDGEYRHVIQQTVPAVQRTDSNGNRKLPSEAADAFLRTILQTIRKQTIHMLMARNDCRETALMDLRL